MKPLILLPLFALGLAGCGGASSQSGTADKAVMFNCADQAGITGGFSSTYTYADGVQKRVINAGNGVTQAQADAANACILRG